MLRIRLNRVGKKNASSFRVVLTEKTVSPKSGKFLEILGFYNPRLKEISLKKERILYWLSMGAKSSDTAHNLLVSQGVIQKPKIKKKIKIKKKKEAEMDQSATKQGGEESKEALDKSQEKKVE